MEELILDERALPWLIVHGFLVLWGLLDLFFGYRIFRALLGIFGAFIGALAGAWLVSGLMDGWMGPAIGGLAGLICGGFLAWYVSVAGIALLGAGAALALAVPLLAGRVDAPWEDVALAGAMVVGGLLAAVAVRPLLIVATSLAGAFRVVFGGAFLLGLGPNLFLLRAATADPDQEVAAPAGGLAETLTGGNELLAWLVLAVAAVGVVVQFVATSPKGGRSK